MASCAAIRAGRHQGGGKDAAADDERPGDKGEAANAASFAMVEPTSASGVVSSVSISCHSAAGSAGGMLQNGPADACGSLVVDGDEILMGKPRACKSLTQGKSRDLSMT